MPPTQWKFKGDHAFFVVATSLWKKQPHHIRCAILIISFKAQLKVHVFSSSLRSLSNCHYYLCRLLSVAAVLAFKLTADFMVHDGCIHDFYWTLFCPHFCESIWSTNVFLAVLEIYMLTLFGIRVMGHTTIGPFLSWKTQLKKDKTRCHAWIQKAFNRYTKFADLVEKDSLKIFNNLLLCFMFVYCIIPCNCLSAVMYCIVSLVQCCHVHYSAKWEVWEAEEGWTNLYTSR